MNGLFTLPFFILFFLLIALSAIGAWFMLGIHNKIKRLLGETVGDVDEDAIHGMMRRVTRLETKAEETDPRLAMLEKIATSSIQKIGFVRFNPFQNTGGDNSFILIMLDRENTGVLLSSLYMREGARLYAKSIEKGKTKHALSGEESKLLEKTLHTI